MLFIIISNALFVCHHISILKMTGGNLVIFLFPVARASLKFWHDCFINPLFFCHLPMVFLLCVSL